MRNRTNKVIGKMLFIACICTVLIFTATACGDNKLKSSREIYIPVLGDEEWLKSDGAFMNGVQLATDELNSEYSGRGFKIKTAVIDDRDQYETGVEMATKVAEDSTVTAVFNLQNFDVSKTTSGILSEYGKTTIFPYGAYDSLFNQGNPYLFCGVPSFSDLGKAMADYTVNKSYKRIAIYHNGTQSQEELSVAFELELLNTGVKVVDYVPYVASQSGFDNIYSRWQALGVDCVVISQYGVSRAFEVLQMLRARDKNIAVIGEPVFNEADALSANKEIAEGIAVPSNMLFEDIEKLYGFKEKYTQEYGKEADIWAIQGYDMMHLVVDTAVKHDTNDSAKIAAALHDGNGYQGISRHIVFTEGGAMITDINKLPVLTCKNGGFK